MSKYDRQVRNNMMDVLKRHRGEGWALVVEAAVRGAKVSHGMATKYHEAITGIIAQAGDLPSDTRVSAPANAVEKADNGLLDEMDGETGQLGDSVAMAALTSQVDEWRDRCGVLDSLVTVANSITVPLGELLECPDELIVGVVRELLAGNDNGAWQAAHGDVLNELEHANERIAELETAYSECANERDAFREAMSIATRKADTAAMAPVQASRMAVSYRTAPEDPAKLAEQLAKPAFVRPAKPAKVALAAVNGKDAVRALYGPGGNKIPASFAAFYAKSNTTPPGHVWK